MIGLAENGRAKLGAIHAPATGRSFAGGDAVPSYEWLPATQEKKPIRVSQLSDFREAHLVLSRSRPSQSLNAIAGTLGVKKVTALGSAGIKGSRSRGARPRFTRTSGRPAGAGTTCGPEAIVRGAGGTSTDAYGQELDYRSARLETSTGLVISNGALHDAVLAAIARELSP